MKRRNRKTAESPVAAKIRAYAAGYAAGGQKEHAQGMLQAADIIDKLMAGAQPIEAALGASDLEARVAHLESAVFSNGASREARAPRTVPAILSDTPKARKAAPSDSTVPALSTGEGRILAAIAQSLKGRTSDELTAIVDLRATSLRTYLGNLRAAGYVETHAGVHQATPDGAARVQEWPVMLVGRALYAWWLEGRMGAGETNILRYTGSREHETSVHELVGDATGLKATSVRTYVGLLMRRKLLVRPSKGTVELAPILLDGVA